MLSIINKKGNYSTLTYEALFCIRLAKSMRFRSAESVDPVLCGKGEMYFYWPTIQY